MPDVLVPPSDAAIRVLGGAEVYDRVMATLRASDVSETDIERYLNVLEVQDAGDVDEARRIAATIEAAAFRGAVLAPLSPGR